jgi:hypothetical protein
MHTLEPFYNWRHLYIADEDEQSPFYGNTYSEFEFSKTVYNYYIHPQWDEFGSRTLYIKVLFVDYEIGVAFIEFIGEWNDAIEDDIMELKREIIDLFIPKGIFKFVMIAENIFNFHSGETDYYEEWSEDITEHDGWICYLNLQEVGFQEMKSIFDINNIYNVQLDNWRTFQPIDLFNIIEAEIKQ